MDQVATTLEPGPETLHGYADNDEHNYRIAEQDRAKETEVTFNGFTQRAASLTRQTELRRSTTQHWISDFSTGKLVHFTPNAQRGRGPAMQRNVWSSLIKPLDANCPAAPPSTVRIRLGALTGTQTRPLNGSCVRTTRRPVRKGTGARFTSRRSAGP